MAGLKCEGCQLGLESLQRCLAHCYLRESIPQHDRSGEETLMVAGERCWNLHKACVMASGSVVKGSQVPFSGNVYLLVSIVVHHRQAGLVSALLQGIPTKVLTHGGDTTCATVVTLDKSDGSSLYHFKLVGVSVVWSPDC